MPSTAKLEQRNVPASHLGMRVMERTFQCPPATHGPVPFYWWAGEKLDRERIAWQLDRLCEKGVRQTVVSYPHHPDGTSDVGDPELFSVEWWDLFRWFLAACRERGMTVGFQDYTLVEPILKAIGRETPGMQGGRMSCVAEHVSAASCVCLRAGEGAIIVGAWAYPMHDGLPDVARATPLGGAVCDGVLVWTAPAGEWFVALVFACLNAFDPLHPDAGALAIERLYAPFERECGNELGKTLNLFFQDELDFGCRMPFWSNRLFEEFFTRKDYDITPWLPMLWHDMGPLTEKVRLDFSDAVTSCVEDCYFKPIFRWHEARGIMFGHDNCGRGWIAQGRDHYGDYFRTMRWYSAPGCDDPKLDGARAFKGLKVNSSIAHLYQRQRVWVEAFHSSGWGTAPAAIVAAINEDFAYGATVVNLHGLYYSTRGGWWEWAPPDFHFRQPYWAHCGALNDYLTRICWVLSQGVHRCDVAIVYPISALDAQSADPGISGVIAHVGNESIGADEGGMDAQPEETAFGLGKYLFDHACDFDFVDFESLAKADARDGCVVVADACYRVLIFPAMKAVRFSMIEKALEFVRAGGLVIAFGCLPNASDRAGREDAVLNGLLVDIFGADHGGDDLIKRHVGGGAGVFLRSGYVNVLKMIGDTIERDVSVSKPLHVLHRYHDERDVYYVFNPSDQAVSVDLHLRGRPAIEQWDAWTGGVVSLPRADVVVVDLAPRESRVFVRSRDDLEIAATASEAVAVPRTASLDGEWQSLIHPTLDNRHGDFILPATSGLLGPSARRFRYCDEYVDDCEWVSEDFDDSGWHETTYSFGAQLEFAGPFPPGTGFVELESALDVRCDSLEWQPYEFSRRWGIEKDPFLTHWLSGPHGLKGVVPDEFLDFESEIVGSVWYLRAEVVVGEGGEFTMVTGGRCGYQVWLDGESVAIQEVALEPGFYAPWGIPHYECAPQEIRVTLSEGSHRLLIKLVQPSGQRTRAFVAFDPPAASSEHLALRWYADGRSPRPCVMAGAERRAIRFRFTSPPGLREIEFVARGVARAWAGGRELVVSLVESCGDGCFRYRARLELCLIHAGSVAIRVEAPLDSHAGDALPEPVSFVCGVGSISLGDWCAHGLATYSGAVEYRKTIAMDDPLPRDASVWLDLTHVVATAEVRLNGCMVATLITAPWVCDLSDFLQNGENELSITVANTLANHYSVGIPTPYAFTSQTPCGLFGPVHLITSITSI